MIKQLITAATTIHQAPMSYCLVHIPKVMSASTAWQQVAVDGHLQSSSGIGAQILDDGAVAGRHAGELVHLGEHGRHLAGGGGQLRAQARCRARQRRLAVLVCRQKEVALREALTRRLQRVLQEKAWRFDSRPVRISGASCLHTIW